MEELEVWEDIKDTCGKYKVSNKGRVKSLVGREKILKPRINRGGYFQIDIGGNKGRYTKEIHRIVAETFIANPNNLPQVDHIDRNKLNINVSNLRWVSVKENSANRRVGNTARLIYNENTKTWEAVCGGYKNKIFIEPLEGLKYLLTLVNK